MIWNFVKTSILFAVLTGILLAVSFTLGFSPLLAIILSGMLNAAVYWFSDRIVLAVTGAKKVSEAEHPKLYAIVDKLASDAGMPKPSVAIVKSPVPNAFATGRSPSHATVAVHSGLLETLGPDELETVLAHEMAHIRNYDTLTSVVVATIAGAVSYLARLGWYMSPAYGYQGQRNRDSGTLAIVAVLLAPIAAVLVQLAITRTREFAADEGAAKLSGRPLSLASALDKIERTVARHRVHGNPALSHLYVVNPFRGSSLVELFSTHPPTWKRIARLQRLANNFVTTG